MHGCIWRVLSVANLFHKPAGISATSGCPWGCKGLWTSKAPCPVWFGESCVATCFRARARDGELAVVHGCICSTTLRRWYSGYHGFKPKLTNKPGFSCKLSCSPSPAVRPSHRRSCDTALIRPCSLDENILVFDGRSPACAWKIGVCLQLKTTLCGKNCTNSPFGAAAGVVANWRSRDRDVEARRSSKDASPECSQFAS